MSIEVIEVKSKKELKTFVKFPFSLYKGNPNWVPPLISDELSSFDPQKNPALKNCDYKLYLAYRDGTPVGRLAAINNKPANLKFNTKNLRFDWFDVINDLEVARALFERLESWARELGMTSITGPHGFTDLDPQGMMVEGFNELSTIAGIYNHPYYPELMTVLGYEKEIDYLEFKSVVPLETGIPEKLVNLARRVEERFKLRVLNFKTKRELLSRAHEIFDVLDEAFEEIYGAVPLNREIVDYYIKKYFSFVEVDLVKVVINEANEIVGFLITMPSLSRAMQKAKGRLLPFGWYHILRALKGENEIIDFYLAGVKKKYRGMGVDLLMAVEITQAAIRRRFKYAESNQELETNSKVQAQWKYFNPVQHKRKRIFRKNLY